MTDLKKRFGQLVAVHRKRQALTQQRLGELAGLSATMIVRIEAGQSGTRFPAVERLAGALRVDPADLFRADGKGTKQTHSTLADINALLAGLSDQDLLWIRELLEVALRAK